MDQQVPSQPSPAMLKTIIYQMEERLEHYMWLKFVCLKHFPDTIAQIEEVIAWAKALLKETENE